ncbi:MAG: hypothetical protein DRR42_07530 [Gammaproteobacteria bacterium]|nr:MAG: hypothetical protein DRR42_07530 [Gammaproteobacteria bacterium]
MRALKWMLVIACSAYSMTAAAAITGPTESSGTYTLTWDAFGEATSSRLIEQGLAGSFWGNSYGGSVTITRSTGTYVYDEEFCFWVDAGVYSFLWCDIVDTHTVVVSSGGTTPPAAPHVITQGDFNSDGLSDIAVIAPVPTDRLVDDFILFNTGSDNYSASSNPTSSQILAARSAPIIAGDVTVGDANFDYKQDVILRNMAFIDDFVIWSSDSQPANHPVRSLRMTQNVIDFISDTVSRYGNPSFFDNAVTTQTVTYTGWFVVDVFVISPGYGYDQYGIWRYFEIGPARILLYLIISQTYNVFDANISFEAYTLGQRFDVLENGSAAEVATAIEEILIILGEILNVDIGVPEIRPPWPFPEDAVVVIPGVTVVIDVLCKAIGVFCDDDSDEGAEIVLEIIGDCEEFALESAVNAILGLDSHQEPKVDAPANQNYQITSGQRSLAAGTTNTTRRSFWVSRLNDSRDPLGPLAIDVVDDNYALGCLANRRYESYAEKYGVTTSLTTAGLLILDAHLDSTDQEEFDGGPFVEAKLGPRQIADYHHEVFLSLGLPKDTFGGTVTGFRDEALISGKYWCPSCDKDN